MPSFRNIYIVGCFPDHLNMNSIIRDYVAAGFAEAASKSLVYNFAGSQFLRAGKPGEGDFCLFMGSVILPEYLIEAQFNYARRCGAKAAIWLQDDPYEFDASLRVIGEVDAIFTNDRAASYHYPEGTPVFHMPLGAAREHIYNVESRTGPTFFFAGYPFSNRIEFFRDLYEKCASIDGLIIGPGWNGAGFMTIDSRIDADALHHMYRNALATIYLGRTHDLLNTRYGIRASTPGPRLFEAAAAGACQIVLSPGLEVLEYFTPGREMLFVESVDEAAQQLRCLQSDFNRSIYIGREAQRRVLEEHLYVHRARSILKIMEEL